MVYNGLRSRAVAAVQSGSSFGVQDAVNKHAGLHSLNVGETRLCIRARSIIVVQRTL